MDAEERDLRKKRRRSVRNLRRTSGLLPLNLNAVDEQRDGGSARVSQSDDSKQEMYGSMWCESLEPVVKKRRRRSSLLVGLVPKPLKQMSKETDENNDRINDNVYSTEIQEDSETVKINNRDSKDVLNCNLIAKDTVLENEIDTFEQVKDINCINLKERGDFQETHVPGTDSNDLKNEINMSEERENIRKVSLNSSDISNRSNHECDLSKVSPTSMSPDFPVSPSTALYQESLDESYIGVSSAVKEPEHNAEITQRVEDCSETSTPSESIQKSPGIDHLSDLSHSDKENSLVNDNAGLNITPCVKDDSAEKLSPGFMSMCKAFAGKVVNFVKTSPSFLTGGILDSRNTTNVCASPVLKGSTSLHLLSNELSKLGSQSDIHGGKSLERFGADSNRESSCSGNVDKNEKLRDIEDTNNIQTESKVEKTDKMVEKNKNSINQVNFGSAKKQRDRKKFFDTFNAVSDELKRDRRRSSCTDDMAEMMTDKTILSDLGIIEEHTEILKEQTNEAKLESKSNKVIDQNEVFMKCSPSLDTISFGIIKDVKMGTNKVPNKIDSFHVSTGDIAQNEIVVRATVAEIQKGKIIEVKGNEPFKNTSKENAVSEKSLDTNTGIETNYSVENENASGQDDLCMEIDKVSNRIFENEDEFCRKYSESKYQNKTETAVESKIENTNEQLNAEFETEVLLSSQNTCVKDNQRRRKRRALDIPNVDYSETDILIESEKGEKIGYCEELCEKKQKLNLEELIEESSQEHTQAISQQPEISIKADSFCIVNNKINSDVKQFHEVSKLWTGKKKESVSKIRNNRRKSFGFQNSETVCNITCNNGHLSDMKNAETGIHTDVMRDHTQKVDEVDGMNEIHNEECHIEKRVAALDLGNENKLNNQDAKDDTERRTEMDNFQTLAESENVGLSQDNNLEIKKRGRRRKSANLNDILKRGGPRKEKYDQILENEVTICKPETKEINNISELTNEISQVQINEKSKQIFREETDISVENLTLPGDDLVNSEHKAEPKRRRRRSAEAASLRLQMQNEEKSPSDTNTCKTDQGKRVRRKSSDAASLRIHEVLEESTCPKGDGSPEFGEATSVTKRGKKRKYKEDTLDELEKIYRNKNFVRPEEKKPWQTVLESPTNSSECFGKKRLQRHIDFERPSQMKLRRRLQKAVKNGWDPKKRKRSELEDDFVQVKLVNLWSELDEVEKGSESLESKLKSIVETN